MDITGYMAIYAAILSTIGVAWQIYIWLRARARIRLTWQLYQDTFDDKSPPKHTHCKCWIVNEGQWATSIINFRVEFDNGETDADSIEWDTDSSMSWYEGMGNFPRPLLLEPGQCQVVSFRYPAEWAIRCCAVDNHHRKHRTELIRPAATWQQ